MKRAASPAILDATLRLIARGGVDAVRYRDVADEAGVPLGTVSYHYAAREDLIRAAFTSFLEQNTETLLKLASRFHAESASDVADFLAELLRADFADRERRYLAEYELIVYAARDRAIAAALAAWDRAMIAELARVLERLAIERPLSAAHTLVDLLRGFQLANLGRAERDIDDFRARVLRVLSAFRAAPTAKQGARHVRSTKAR